MSVVSPPGSCKEAGCDRPAESVGLCNRHWMSHRRKDRKPYVRSAPTEPAIEPILGPCPCQRCRAIVIWAKVGGVPMWVTKSTGRVHECAPIPDDWSWSSLVKEYGEEGALHALERVGGSSLHYEEERQRKYHREYQRERRKRKAADGAA